MHTLYPNKDDSKETLLGGSYDSSAPGLGSETVWGSPWDGCTCTGMTGTLKAGTVMSSSLLSQQPVFNKCLNEWTKVSSPIHFSCFLSITLLLKVPLNPGQSVCISLLGSSLFWQCHQTFSGRSARPCLSPAIVLSPFPSQSVGKFLLSFLLSLPSLPLVKCPFLPWVASGLLGHAHEVCIQE